MRKYPEPFEGKPEADVWVSRKQPNKGELQFDEKHPADPLKDELTQTLTHRGGLVSPRTDFY